MHIFILLVSIQLFKKIFNIFIYYLAVPGLWHMGSSAFFVACRFFSCRM